MADHAQKVDSRQRRSNVDSDEDVQKSDQEVKKCLEKDSDGQRLLGKKALLSHALASFGRVRTPLMPPLQADSEEEVCPNQPYPAVCFSACVCDESALGCGR